jgi:uncharacterized membrane protein YdjX (TVP38/TMEM64 family)
MSLAKEIAVKTRPGETRPRDTSRVPKIAAIVAVIAGLIALWATLPIGVWIDLLRTWVKTQGLLGHVVFALVYALAAVALAPGSALTLAAGFAFGLAGFPTVIAARCFGRSTRRSRAKAGRSSG